MSFSSALRREASVETPQPVPRRTSPQARPQASETLLNELSSCKLVKLHSLAESENYMEMNMLTFRKSDSLRKVQERLRTADSQWTVKRGEVAGYHLVNKGPFLSAFYAPTLTEAKGLLVQLHSDNLKGS